MGNELHQMNCCRLCSKEEILLTDRECKKALSTPTNIETDYFANANNSFLIIRENPDDSGRRTTNPDYSQQTRVNNNSALLETNHTQESLGSEQIKNLKSTVSIKNFRDAFNESSPKRQKNDINSDETPSKGESKMVKAKSRTLISAKEINRSVDRESILKDFIDPNLVNRERSFPLFTKEYAIEKFNISLKELNTLYLPQEIVFDHGTYIPNRSFYFGEKNRSNEKHGFGMLYLCDGTKYTGFWKNNDFSYYGRFIDKELTVYEGAFSNLSLHGRGEETTITNSNYSGTFYHGMKEGKGTLRTESEVYEGDFEQGLKHGKGKIMFTKSGNRYEGDFTEGKIEGHGSFTWASGDQYKGAFKNGILHGFGAYFWVNGDVYEGLYSNGIRCGKGKLKNANGKIYEGEFRNNVPHGKGVIIKDNKVSTVEFENGVPLGKKLLTNTVVV